MMYRAATIMASLAGLSLSLSVSLCLSVSLSVASPLYLPARLSLDRRPIVSNDRYLAFEIIPEGYRRPRGRTFETRPRRT